MPRIPRTKDQILNEAELLPFVPTNHLESLLPFFLEVLIDIRDNLELTTYEDDGLHLLD